MNDFRAGSGPVTLTCQAWGVVSARYQWTFTCTGACFLLRSPTSQSVTQGFLRAGVDDGTHICTATDGGKTGSASFVMRIIGMFVSSLICPGITVSVAQSVSYLWLWFLVCSATVDDGNSYKDTGRPVVTSQVGQVST